LARDPLLARAGPLDEELGALLFDAEALLLGALGSPPRQLPGLGRRVVADLAARLLHRLDQTALSLPAGDQHENGVGSGRPELALQSLQLSRLPRVDSVDHHVARAGAERERRERRRHLVGPALARVARPEGAGPVLLLGPPAHPRPPGVDLGVVIACE